MKLLKVFNDDDLNPQSGWACLEKGRLILKNDFMGLPAGSRLLVKSNYVVRFRDTCEFNQFLRAEQNQVKFLSKKEHGII